MPHGIVSTTADGRMRKAGKERYFGQSPIGLCALTVLAFGLTTGKLAEHALMQNPLQYTTNVG